MVVISAKRVDVDIKTIINPANRNVPVSPYLSLASSQMSAV